MVSLCEKFNGEEADIRDHVAILLEMPLKEHGMLGVKSLQRTLQPEEVLEQRRNVSWTTLVVHVGSKGQSHEQSHRPYYEEAETESGADGGDDSVDNATTQPTTETMLTKDHYDNPVQSMYISKESGRCS
ncbi:hypothetical protein K437DRAFT_188337 [Tilletiaria anomala UBC 951]|uniref:Uncharacterized protein n=1 Tax=Tilletiaria anomala (strain ATCC 24038 / CBS 436.72 / UBC 951) TaxID=1037660 RepID=A0A066VFK8_TILAU|nr:uncharacterized protein K437DRAFT_188337 [Tilletiaria anomala UBC 951]KDN40522.1 hypothetical protein K437DRAFT_188337 [Tilletiaria anomala UBC 951]